MRWVRLSLRDRYDDAESKALAAPANYNFRFISGATAPLRPLHAPVKLTICLRAQIQARFQRTCQVDVSTLFFVESSLLFLFSLTMIVNSIGQPGQGCNYWFAASNFCGGLSLLLDSTFPVVPAFSLVILANLLLFLELTLINKAIAEFVGRGRTVWLYLLALSVLMTAGSAFFTLSPANHVIRIAMISVVCLAAAVCSAALLFQSLRGEARISTVVMGTLLSLYATTNALRLLTIRSFPREIFYHIWLDRTIIAGLSFGFLWMTADRLRTSLARLADTDALTGTLNRRAIERETERAITRSRNPNSSIAAIMLDVDSFKQINDSFGHHAGDLALCAIADCIRHATRAGDLIARLGGDEFLVIMPNTDTAMARLVAGRIQTQLAEILVTCETGKFGVQVSIGITSIDSVNLSLDDLMKLGDRALYASKEASHRSIPNRPPPGYNPRSSGAEESLRSTPYAQHQ
jgi:diguanylate cyclase (GGDEF)-like protein